MKTTSRRSRKADSPCKFPSHAASTYKNAMSHVGAAFPIRDVSRKSHVWGQNSTTAIINSIESREWERNIIFTISTSGDESSPGFAKCSNLQLLTQLFDLTIVSFLEKFHERQKIRKLHNSLLFNYEMNLLLIKFLCFCSIYFCRFVVQIPLWTEK